MHQIARATYAARGGLDPNLPGGASVTGAFGRSDIRLQMGLDGELYLLSKADGMIRALASAVPEPATAWLMSSAALMLMGRRRKR
jgi:hypothetical protein